MKRYFNYSCTLAFACIKQLWSTAQVLNRGRGEGAFGNIWRQLWYHKWGGVLLASCAYIPGMLLNILQRAGQAPPQNYLTPNAKGAKAEKPWSTASQTYHLIHGVTGVVVFWVGAANPHRLKKFFFLLLIFVGQCLLRLFFLYWGIILLFASALAVTPSVFFFLPTSSLFLPTWGATLKGGKGR